MFGDLVWPLTASFGFVSISWAFCSLTSPDITVCNYKKLSYRCQTARRV